jgi:hypothetical protein
MPTVTWRELIGYEFQPGMPQPVALYKKRLGSLTPMVQGMMALLARSVDLGAPPPTVPAQAWGRGALTPHNIGAAIDIFYDATKPGPGLGFAHGLLDQFIRFQRELGWAYIAYDRMEFSASRVTEAPNDNDHLGHIHIDWVDYGRSTRSKALSTFTYQEQAGAKVETKVVGGGQWVSMTSNAGADRSPPASFVTAFETLCANARGNSSLYERMNASDFAAAYHSAQTDFEMTWLHGWWSVNDGNQYYYYFGPKGFVQYTKTRPTALVKPPAHPLNRGMYFFAIGELVIDWNPADGGATQERFVGGPSDSMSGRSNRYAPLQATRL